jgi:hypothetical protein
VIFDADDATARSRRAYPDTLVGTDSHTTMINGLGVLGWGVGGIEAEAAMLGQPVTMLIPQVIGFKLTASLPAGATATDLVLTVTEMLRKKGVVDKFVEFFGDGLKRTCRWPTAPPSPTCRPSSAAPAASSRSTRKPSATSKLTGRSRRADRAGRGLRQGTRACGASTATGRRLHRRARTRSVDVEPSSPARSVRRIACR